jgi:hypothetical protein
MARIYVESSFDFSGNLQIVAGSINLQMPTLTKRHRGSDGLSGLHAEVFYKLNLTFLSNLGDTILSGHIVVITICSLRFLVRAHFLQACMGVVMP